MEVAHIDAFRSDPARFWSFYGERFATLGDKQPNGAHDALVALERRGLLDARDHAEHRHAAPQGRHARARRGARQHRDLLAARAAAGSVAARAGARARSRADRRRRAALRGLRRRR